MKIKKILVLTTNFPRWPNEPRATFVYEAVKALQKLGCEVKVIAMHIPGARTHEIWDGIEIFRPKYLPEKFEILQNEGGGLPEFWRKSNLLKKATIIPFFITQSLAVIRYSKDCQIIHANWTLSGAAAWITKWIHHLPFIVTVQGSDIFQAPKNRLFRIVTNKSLNSANKVIALSKSLMNDTINLGVPQQKILVIPNGVDISTFHRGEINREPVILFVGSLIKRKGPEFLLDAFNLVQKVKPEYRIIFIGDGSLRQYLEKKSEELSINDKVQFLGFQPPEIVAKKLRSAMVFVLPSLEEGLGVVLLEALASGTPIVSSSVGGIVDVVNQDTGILVPPADSKSLANAILEIIENESNWKARSNHCRELAESKFDWNVIAGQLLDLYEEV